MVKLDTFLNTPSGINSLTIIGGKHMKPFKLVSRLTLLVWIAVIGFGCQKNGPVETADVVKGQAPQFIKLPQSDGLQKPITVTARITKDKGGELRLQYEHGEGSNELDVDMKLKFPKDAVSADLDVSMTIDDEVLMTTVDISFAPHGIQFLRPAILDVDAKGLDLSGVPVNAKITLYYSNNGVWEEVEVKKVEIDLADGEVELEDGEIKHFSRYAFGY